MPYPVITRAGVIAYVEGRAEGRLTDLDLKVEYNETVATDWVDSITDVLDGVLTSFQDQEAAFDKKRDELEGILSVDLYEGFSGLPASILTDKDFWRYASAYLYDYVVWRQPAKTVQAVLPYMGSASNGLGRECVPHRMFDRALIAGAGGEAAGDDDIFALAKFGASDVWKSHILRVANGNAPRVVHEILTDVKGGELKTEVVRPFVRNLRRVRANVLFEVLDLPQARDLVDRERDRTLAASVPVDVAGVAH